MFSSRPTPGGSRFDKRSPTASMQSYAAHSRERCGTAAARTGMSMRTDAIPTSGRGPLRATAGERPESIERNTRSAPGHVLQESAVDVAAPRQELQQGHIIIAPPDRHLVILD